MTEQRSFLKELKRRKVVRVAVVYAATAFAVLEAADIAAPRLGLPDWTVTLVLLLAALGFPIALVMAWAFDLTPAGVRRTSDPEGEATAATPGWLSMKTILGAGVLVIVAVAGGWWAGSGGAPASSEGEEAPPRSVAVLPFANMSGEQANEYFSDGLAEEILNVLAKVEGLKVAARTSSFAYRDRNEDIRSIADELGVGTVLEGSVRRAGDQVRVTAQLIQASDGFHLWSDTYDRRLEDIFAIQEDIAERIVGALQVELGMAPEEVVGLERPTDDLEAYQLFLQARHLFHQRTEESLYRSIELYEEAVELDPEFAEAHVGLAMVYAVLPGYADPEFDALERARTAAELALSLDSTQAWGYAVMGYLAQDRFDFRNAHSSYRRALELSPDDPTVLLWAAIPELVAGRVERGGTMLERAFELDPASGVINGWMGHLDVVRGNLGSALARYERSMKLSWGAGRHWLCTVAIAAERYHEVRDRCDPEVLGSSISPRTRNQLTAIHQAGTTTDPDERREALRLLDVDGTVVAPTWNAPEAFFAALALLRDEDRVTSGAWSSIWRPEASDLRQDPRFIDWVERAGLPEYWDEVGWPELCSRAEDGRVSCR